MSMASSYESVFLSHISSDDRIKPEVLEKIKVKKPKSPRKSPGKQVSGVMNHILKKYRKNWWGYGSARKKKTVAKFATTAPVLKESSEVGTESFCLTKGNSWPSLHQQIDKELFSATDQEDTIIKKRRSLDSSDLPNGSFCTSFPIAEIGTELSGNRGNGNSPFNSSNSCGSPEGIFSVETPAQKQSAAGQTEQKDTECNTCSKCLRELNNNTERTVSTLKDLCTCNDKIPESRDDKFSEALNCEESDSKGDVDSKVENSEDEDTDMESEEEYVRGDEDDEDYVEEEEEDESDWDDSDSDDSVVRARNKVHNTTPGGGLAKIKINLKSSSPVQYVGSSSSHLSRKPAPISPVKWQQQFMSFLSTSAPPEEEDILTQEPEVVEPLSGIGKSPNKMSHSPRRKRSRSVRNSVCSCCFSMTEKKLKHGEGRHHDSSKRLTRQQKHFIRDMVQLVALRNKIVKVLRTLFPDCVERLDDINPDTESVDDYIDQIIEVVKSPVEILFSNDEMELTDSQCRIGLDDKCFEETAEYPSLTKLTDPSETDNLIAFRGNLDHKKESGNMPILDNCLSLSESFENKITESLGHEGPSTSHRHMFSEGDSGIVQDENESHLQQESMEESEADLDDSNVQSLCDKPSLCDNSPDRCSKYLGISVAIMPEKHSNVKSGAEEQELPNSEKGLVSAESHDEVDGVINTPDSCSKSLNDGHENVKSERTRTLSCDIEMQDNNQDESSGVKKTLLFGRSVSLDRVEDPAPKRESLFDKLILDSSTGSDRSDPFICLSATISDSPKKTDSSAISNTFLSRLRSLSYTEHKNSSDAQSNVGDSGDGAQCVKEQSSSLESAESENQPGVIDVYDLNVRVCSTPKLCLQTFKRKVLVLLYWLLPDLALENNFLKNVDNLEYLLDAIIFSNQRPLSVEV